MQRIAFVLAVVFWGGTMNLQVANAEPATASIIPALRIPKLTTPPKIDGKIEPGEWDGAACVTGFRDFSGGLIVPRDLQPTWWIAYDDQNLYLAQRFPLYPKGCVKAHVKVGDRGGLSADTDAILNDDHVEIQICDLPKREQAVKQYFYKIITNPYKAVVDQRTEWSVGWFGFEWESKAEIGSSLSDDAWTLEMAIPFKSLHHDGPPPDGTRWFMQLVSAGGANTSYYAWQPVGWLDWDQMPEIVFDSKAPAAQLTDLGDPMNGKLDLRLGVQESPGSQAVSATVRVTDEKGTEVYSKTEDASPVVPGGSSDASIRRELVFAAADLAPTDKPSTIHIDVKTADGTTLYRAALPFVKTPADIQEKVYKLLASGRSGPGKPEISSCYYHSYHKLEATCDVDILRVDPRIRAANSFHTSIRAADGKEMVQQTGPIDSAGQGRILADVPALPEGEYVILTEIPGEDGKPLASREDHFRVRTFPWEGNNLGKEKIVVRPFTPVKMTGQRLDVWGRRYTFGSTGFPVSIVSKGEEILAAPLRLEATIDGRDIDLQPGGKSAWKTAGGYNGLLESRAKLGPIDVVVRADTEFDGTTKYELSFSGQKDTPVDRIDLVIPLRKMTGWEAVRNGRDAAYGTAPTQEGVFWSAADLPPCANILGTFLPYCCVSDGERALAWAADSDEGWLLDDAKSSFFLERLGDTINMRIRFCNTPSHLAHPRTIRFMLQAMPEKAMPADYRYRMWDTPNASFGYSAGFQGSCFWAYGVGPAISLYKPEDYTILKGLLDADRERCRQAADRAPGPKFPGVTSWYSTTNCLGLAMPEYDTYAGEWVGVTEPKPSIEAGYINYKSPWGVWSTPRQQSRAYADLCPSTVDCRVWCYAMQLEKAGLDGYWWDHIRFWSGGSLIKGSAYVREDGKVQGRFNISAMREMMRRMAVIADTNGVTPFQGYYAHGAVGPIGSFLQYLWAIEGPWYMTSAKTDLLDNFRGGLDGIKVLMNRYSGVPVSLRGETFDRGKDDPFQSRCCLGVGLLLDVGVGFEGGNVDQKTRQALLKVLADFGYFEAANEWIPYWRTQDGVRTEGGDLLATVYQRKTPGRSAASLIVLFNNGDTPCDAKVTVANAAGSKLTDLETGQPIETIGGAAQVAVKRHDFRLIVNE